MSARGKTKQQTKKNKQKTKKQNNKQIMIKESDVDQYKLAMQTPTWLKRRNHFFKNEKRPKKINTLVKKTYPMSLLFTTEIQAIYIETKQ